MSVETELKAIQDKIMMQVREHHLGLKASIDALSRSFAELHSALRDEKESRVKDMEQLAITISSKIDEVQSNIDDERVSRLERESQTLKRIGDDVFKCQEKIDLQRKDMEQHIHSLQGEFQSIASLKDNSVDVYDKFQGVVMQEVNMLKAAIHAEKEERQSEDEQIVHAINDYTRALQDGLRIVNNT